MPSRRSHPKSRNGCVQCKARKIKCDEHAPICFNCSKTNRTCQFPASIFPTQFPASAFDDSYMPNMATDNPDPTYNVKDLELMHFCSTVTYQSFSDEEPLQPLAQQTLPQEAFSHDFFMHSLLVLSALHFIHDHPARRTQFAELAITHHNAALKRYMLALGSITRENCTAIFACSAILVFCAFAFPRFTDGGTEGRQDPVDEMLQVFTLLRGVNAVIQTSRERILEGGLGSLLRNDITKPTGYPPQDVEVVLEELELHNTVSSTDGEKRNVYHTALQLLRHCFGISVATAGDKDIVLSWPIVVSEEYLSLLRHREPMAIVILAHYAVILHSLDHRWWAQSRGSQLVSDLVPLVGEEWSRFMVWPRMKTLD